jgi:Cellulase (glycosyl hydrolase family 5)
MKTPIRFLFTLLCVSLFGAAQGQTENPNGQSLIPAKTRWVAKIDNPESDMARGRFELYDISSGSPVLLNGDFPVKGMAYSPIRINENINFARWLSDIFWDNVKPDPFSPDVVNGRLTQNYRFNWADGQCMLPNPESCRGDLTRMNKLNVNTIRVYGMTSRFLPVRQRNGNYETYTPDSKDQNNPDLVARCTHKSFLDDCAAHGIYVIVGLFLDSKFWDKSVWDLQKTDPNIKNQILWYEKAYKEVVEEVGNHPAVMGFIINNEIDGLDITYKNPELARFFWYQMKTISSTIKEIAPNKLVGVAFHQDNKLVWGAQNDMKYVPNIDYWGVNVYQKDTTGLANIFNIDENSLLGYSKLSSQAKKPLLFTEMGWPQTTRTIPSKECDGRLSITDGDETVTQGVSDLMRLIGGKLHVAPDKKEFPLCPGTFYFEFSDEWYKEGDKHVNAPCLEEAKRLCTWIGTNATNTNFPGGWWDEAGFGVFSTKRAFDIPDCARTFDYLPQFNYFGPLQAYDRLELGTRKPELMTRKYLHKAIHDVYGVVPVAPSGASIPTN